MRISLVEDTATGMRTVPEQLIGCWKRHSIRFPDGSVDRDTKVIWLQTASGVADIRISATRPDLRNRDGLSSCGMDELLALCEQDCFCATTLFDPTSTPLPLAIWPTSLDLLRFQPVVSFPEPGQLEWKSNGTVMMEYAPSGAYEEEWRLLETEPDFSINIVKLGEGITDHLYVTGSHAIRARSRRHAIAQRQSLSDIARSLGNNLDAIRDLLDCEFSYAQRQTPTDAFVIELSTLPWLEGEKLSLDWIYDIPPQAHFAPDPDGKVWSVKSLWRRS